MERQFSRSEIIRRIALYYLLTNPEGIRFSDLRKLTENVLSDYIPKDDTNSGMFRSALWNIHALYPDYVVKKSLPSRRVVLFPTAKLAEDIESGNFYIPQLESITFGDKPQEVGMVMESPRSMLFNRDVVELSLSGKVANEIENNPKLKLRVIKKLLDELIDHVDNSGLIPLLDLSLDDMTQLEEEYIQTIIGVKHYLESIKRFRNKMFDKKS